ncbi:MAG TPA: GNAT family N-acetyltransferase [Caulobacteraceae bacterium]|jgi:GNAT superfamily N-acetyltransferase|nr:GNAT family N-acetyltransferase [Caulobacteraceae bacterium]
MERLAAYNIVPAGPGDAAALARVHVRSWRETYPGLLPGNFLAQMNTGVYARRWRRQLMSAEPQELVLAAEGAGGLVGYCAGCVDGPVAEISTLYLIRPAQRRGLGRRLLGSVAKVARARGASGLQLWVLNGNANARGFYDHLGGVPVDERMVGRDDGDLRETAYRWSDIRVLSGG